jgi:hypothetical protein
VQGLVESGVRVSRESVCKREREREREGEREMARKRRDERREVFKLQFVCSDEAFRKSRKCGC